MIRPLANRILVRSIVEKRSDVLWTPSTQSRWGNGEQCTKGEVIEIGPEVDSVKVGEIVHFSDSCGKPANENGVAQLLIREDDVMFVEEEPVKAEWIGAKEVPCEIA